MAQEARHMTPTGAPAERLELVEDSGAIDALSDAIVDAHFDIEAGCERDANYLRVLDALLSSLRDPESGMTLKRVVRVALLRLDDIHDDDKITVEKAAKRILRSLPPEEGP